MSAERALARADGGATLAAPADGAGRPHNLLYSRHSIYVDVMATFTDHTIDLLEGDALGGAPWHPRASVPEGSQPGRRLAADPAWERAGEEVGVGAVPGV